MIRALAMTAALATAITVTAATGATAAPATVEIVDLVIGYDDAVWHVDFDPATRPLLFPAAAGPVLAIFVCVGNGCSEDSVVFVSATPVDGDASPPDAIDPVDDYNTRPLWHDDAFARDINGLAVSAHLTFSGCRALSPSQLRADIEHAGHRYSFASGMALGCGGMWSVGQEAFLYLISGVRPAR